MHPVNPRHALGMLLATARLVLRHFRPADAVALQRYRSDPGVARHQSWTAPISTDAATTLVERFATGDPTRPGWFQYAVELGGILIGDLGVLLHDNLRQADLGFTIAPEHQGHGYATEAVTAVLDDLFARGVHRVCAECDARNRRSMRLLQRVGFRIEGYRPANTWIKGEWTDDLLFGLLAENHVRTSRSPGAMSDATTTPRPSTRPGRGFYCRRMPTTVPSLADLLDVLSERTDPADYPHASAVEQEVLVYDADGLRAAPAEEIVRAFADGPGVVVIRGAYPDTAVVDRATAVFDQLIAAQAGTVAGDHFATPGSNDRIWNALEKLAVTAPEVFVEYYANDVIAIVSHAWLGPGYQVTSQPNVVHPGGKAQVGHRDYHLGFLPPQVIEQYPEHVHRLSPVLTLQGAVAHCDMPLESGPTLYLPHSQKYGPGYLATARPEFRAHFEDNHVQLPLGKGDAAFFNPAVIHGAGSNRSAGVHRMANLLQVSSAFGRAMDAVDRARVCAAIYPALRAHPAPEHAIAAAAEGYAFPTNLDRDRPVDGLAPRTQADLVRRALAQSWDEHRFADALNAHTARRATA